MLRRTVIGSGLSAAVSLSTGGQSGAVSQPSTPLRMLAAFALERPLRALTDQVRRELAIPVEVSFESSEDIVQGVASGEQCDVLICSERWMRPLRARLGSRPRTWKLATAKLVLVAARGAQVPLTVREGFAVGQVVGDSRFAIGDPGSVPAGLYGRVAMMKLGGWIAIAPRLIEAGTIQDVLSAVASGRAILGIVYDTDALADSRVKIVGYFPPDTYPEIVYEAALPPSAQVLPAERLINYLRGPQGAEMFRRFGFGVPR